MFRIAPWEVMCCQYISAQVTEHQGHVGVQSQVERAVEAWIGYLLEGSLSQIPRCAWLAALLQHMPLQI